MSVSRGCEVIERQPNKWYCVVAQEEYDYDFCGDYSVYGPKPTSDAASEEMHRHEANPGGYNVIAFDRLTPREIALVDEGLKTKSSRIRYLGRHGNTDWHPEEP